MAIVRFGSLLAAASGSLGSICFARQGSQPIVRLQPLPRRSARPLELTSRAQFSRARAAWSALTDENRAAWANAAAQNPQPNRLGINKQVSPFNAFVQSAMRAIRASTTIPSTPLGDQAMLSQPITSIQIWPAGPALLEMDPDSILSPSYTTLHMQRCFSTDTQLPGRLSRSLTISPQPATVVDFYSQMLPLIGQPQANELIRIASESWSLAWPRSIRQTWLVNVQNEGPNLVYNGGIEIGGTPPAGYVLGGSGTLTQGTLGAYEGSHFMAWVVPAASALSEWGSATGYRYALAAGEQIIIRFAVQLFTGSVGTIALAYDSSHEYSLGVTLASGTSHWQPFEIAFTVPATAANYYLLFRTPAAAPVNLRFDAFSIRRVLS